MEENTQNKQPEQEADKPQSRTFTQSENDRLVGEAIKREREKFADYDEVKKAYDALMAEKKERDMAEKSEVEKLQSMLSEANTELTNVRGELSQYQKKQLRADVLNGDKFVRLPRAYKNMVSLSENIEEIRASAEEVLKEYENDTKDKVTQTFGIPKQPDTTISEPGKVIETTEGMANALRSRVASLIKSNNRG